MCAHFFLQRKLRLTELNKNLKVTGVINGRARDLSLGVSVSKLLVSPRTGLYSNGQNGYKFYLQAMPNEENGESGLEDNSGRSCCK